MSEENVEAVKRGIEAFNREDVEGILEELDAEVEFQATLQVMLGGAATVYRGHEGIRELLRDLDSAFAELHIGITEIRDLGERVVGIGRIRGRGKESGAEVESPYGIVVELKNGKGVQVSDYLDPQEALEAAGLSG
jgi:uncharacterized protein